MDYKVKDVKTFQGNEGDGFTCSVFLDGVCIGTASDKGDKRECAVVFCFKDGEKEKLDKYCEGLEDAPSRYFIENTGTDTEYFIIFLITQVAFTKEIMKLSKTHTIFRINREPHLRSINKPFTLNVKKSLEKVYADNDLVIINEKI